MNTRYWFYPRLKSAGSPAADYIYPTSKVVCVGRNYAAHAQELNNPVPQEPLLFIKPNSSLCDISKGVQLPRSGEICHHELEVAILIAKVTQSIEPEAVRGHIAGVGLALDLTLRGVQENLKNLGQPWEKAKAFDGACPVTEFLAWEEAINLTDIDFYLTINGNPRQKGNTAEMIFPIDQLVSEISRHFTLYPGDIVITGTPSGVASLHSNDLLELGLDGHQWHSRVV